jgi:predicted MFS family arabinose efflux permease
MNVIQRARAPIPKFFKVLRNIGLALGAVGGTIVAVPIGLPMVSYIGGYMAVAGSVLSAVSQLTSQNDDLHAGR